jgi:prepilin-type N-terminal cleavage/methylation domain-containing protein
LLKNGFKASLSALILKTNKSVRHLANRCSGFTLVEVIIVGTLVGLLAAIAIPSFLRSRNAAHRSTCVNNLKQIDSAIQQWAAEHGKPQTAVVDFSDIRPYLKGAIACPSGGRTFSDSYLISIAGDLPVCQKDPQNHVWQGPAIDLAANPKQ